jgi:mannose-6-phosphate isomerase-like protein (cupin superfamily)
VIVYDLSPEAVSRMERFNLAELSREPDSPIGRFPFHGCQCGVASFVGRPPWEYHADGDELLLVLDGASELTVLEDGREDTRVISAGQIAIVPKAHWHVGEAAEGVTMLYMTPAEGNQHSWERPAS